MSDDIALLDQDNINDKIYTIRGVQVMLDEDLANLYEVNIKRLNEQVKRNIERFPENFMFQLTFSEYDSLRSQFATIEKGRGMHKKYRPFAFTEQGVAMLSAVLRSDTAVKMSINIIKAFVTMRRFISSNAQIFQRLDILEIKQYETDKKIDGVLNAIESRDVKPKQGIFFDGQIFDAYVFISDLIRGAKKSIVLVDNYVDDSVLTLFSKRREGVDVVIYTKNITKQLRLDLDKYNSQYQNIVIKEFKRSHDRFMIIDDKEVYHIGASLKDLGKRWFAFSKLDKCSLKLLELLE